ncbi:MAG: Maf family protein [Pseudomonadota bacterium]
MTRREEIEAGTSRMPYATPQGAMRIVLASSSRVRLALLGNAGVEAVADPAHIDEAEIKRAMKAEGSTADAVAEALAELKATRTSRRHQGGLVIGADQILDLDGIWFDKPETRAAAAAQLAALSGKTHRLIGAAVAVRDGARIWHHVGVVRLSVRPLTPGFIERYLDTAGEAALGAVGAYQLEGLGAQLFARIEGDYFTVLGLPLLPLLAFLRGHGLAPE